MINVLFFTQVRELLGITGVTIDENIHITTAETLRENLGAKGEEWAKVMSSDRLLVAVNQTISSWDTEIRNGDEVAFFFPVLKE